MISIQSIKLILSNVSILQESIQQSTMHVSLSSSAFLLALAFLTPFTSARSYKVGLVAYDHVNYQGRNAAYNRVGNFRLGFNADRYIPPFLPFPSRLLNKPRASTFPQPSPSLELWCLTPTQLHLPPKRRCELLHRLLPRQQRRGI